MFSDKSKVILLASLFGACLGTFFISNTFYCTDGGVGKVNPQLHKLCEVPRKEASECLSVSEKSNSADDVSAKATSSSCAVKLSHVTRCERSVAKAYKDINMGGCIKEIQAMTICQLEWCDHLEERTSEDSAAKACRKECDPLNKKLQKCQDSHVKRYFASAGLNSDGSMIREK